MFGNMINNNQLIHLKDVEKIIDITPWQPNLLKTAHYPLKPRAVYKYNNNSILKQIHNFERDEGDYILSKNEYVIVEVDEIIKLPKGIIGQFVPSSNLIEQGLGITAGRLEHPYGQKGQRVRFGLKNLLDKESSLKEQDQLVYLQLFDLRGLDNNKIKLTERDLKILNLRRNIAEDDGPFYED